jgi:release factor glutamine methyltransferase
MTWRSLRAGAARRLSDAGILPADTEARFMVERASGYDADEWLDVAEIEPPSRAARRLQQMVDRRVAGEPLQYVLGAWSFRGLDLLVDARVLIPRPETEFVVEVALEEAERLGLRRTRRRLALVTTEPNAFVADLGTGSGAIALALAAELPDTEVWATDASDDALAVAHANVAGCAAPRVRLAPAGLWFDALPLALRGRLRLIVSNPPYIAAHEVSSLPAEVADHEPVRALVAGEAGTEALDILVRGAPAWLMPGASLVLELAPHQAAQMADRALAVGYRDAFVRDDLTGRPRALVARTG